MDIPPWLRKLGLGLVAVLVAAAALATGFFVFLHTGPGERWTSGKLEDAVAGLELDGYHLGWPFRMRADYLRLGDAQGPWLEATAPELVWHPLRLWRRVLDIDRLVARKVVVRRLPQQAGDGGESAPPLSGRLRLGELDLPIRLDAPVLGEPVELELAGTALMAGSGGTVDVSLRDQSGGLVRLDGTAGTDYLDLRWYLRIPDLARWQRLAGTRLAGGATGSGVIAGRLPSPEISGRLELGAGGADRLDWRRLALTALVVPTPDSWRLAIQSETEAPAWSGKPMAPTAALSVIGDLQPQRGRLRLGHARLTVPAVTVDGSGMIDDWGRQAFLRLTTLAELPPLTGRVVVRGQVAGDLLIPTLTGQFDLTGRQLATGNPLLDHTLGHRPRARLDVHLRGDRLSLGPSRLSGARATLWAQGALMPRLDAWARLDLPDAATLADGLAGSARAWAHVGGTVATPALAGIVHLDGVGPAGAPPAYGAVAFDLPDPARPQGQLSADVLVAGQKVLGSARLERGAGIRLSDLRLSSNSSRLGGDLEFHNGVHGRLTGSIPDLGAWAEVAGRPLAGRVEAEAVLDPTLRLSLRGEDIAVAGQSLDHVSLRVSVQPGRLTVEQTELSADGIPIRLQRPTLVSWREQTVTVAPATFAVGTGQVTVNGRREGRMVQARARLAAVPLDLADMGAVGSISGVVDADGAVSSPNIRFALTGRDIGMAQAGVGQLSARLDGGWKDGRVQARAEISDGHSLRAQAEGEFPLPGDGAISGRLHATGDAARLAESLPLSGHVIAGRLDASATVAGTMAAPRLNGHADLSNGRYENLDNGTVVTPLHAAAILDGERISVTAEGGDGGDGTVRLTGRGDLDGTYAGDITLNRFTVLRRGDAEAAASGTVHLGDERIAGSLTVPRAEVNVGQLRGGGPVKLDVIEINRPGGDTPAPAKTEHRTSVALALAIDVAVEHAFVRGRGLDSEWRGDVTVGGTTTQPSLTGRLVAARGQYEALGKAFKLTPDSAVIFQGGDTIDPSLAVTAEADAADITAQVQVTGTAKAPEIAFTSSPPLPPDEVLARLLFGREAGSLSAFQQIQLAQMAASGLTGDGGGFDPIGSMRGFLGLDVLGVGSETDRAGNGGPTVSAGKYIGPDTFVRVDQGTAGLGRVTIEQGLGGGFSVESSVGELSGGGIGLNWRKDY